MGIQPDKHDLGPEMPPQEPPGPKGVAGAMAVAALLGAVIGAVIGLIFLPDLVVALAIVGAMTLAALRTVVFLSSQRRGLAPVDEEDGTMQ